MTNHVANIYVVDMTPKEAIDAIDENYPFVNLQYLRVALRVAIEALRFQQELVRCRDCAHYTNPEIGWCDIHSHLTSSDEWTTFNDDSFCSDGERRDGE